MKGMLLLLLSLIVTTASQAAEITFRPGDTIEVTVFNSPELSGSFRIQSDGNLRIPLVGKISAAGKTEDELYQSIRTSVDTFIKNPYITVIPKFTVSVLGAVSRPGTFTVTGSERPIELIAQAGGFSSDASGKVTLYRAGEKVAIARRDILHGNSSIGFLQPGDVLAAEKKAFTKADYSIIISTLSAISLSIYYISHD